VSTKITVFYFKRVLFIPSQTGTAAFVTFLDLSWSFKLPLLPLICLRVMEALYLAHACCWSWI